MSSADNDSDDNGPRTGQAEDPWDLGGLSQEIAASHLRAAMAHQNLKPSEPLDLNEVMHGDMLTTAAHATVMAGRDPAVGAWLTQPRPVRSRLIAFLLGCALVTGLYIWFGVPGVFGAGYLLGPLIAPAVSLVLARLLFSWVHHVQVPKQEPDGFSVFNYFAASVNLTVGTIITATGSWLAYDKIILAIPTILLIWIPVSVPWYYLGLKDAHN